MRTLPTEFSKNGFDYKLIVRDTYRAIFAQKLEDKDYAYEVIRIKSYPTREVSGSIIEEGEYYPSTNSWGTDGFTFKDYHKAMDKYLKLEAPKKKVAL